MNASTELSAQDRAAFEMSSLILEIAKALVDDPDAVRLDTVPSEVGTVVLRLQVSPGDLGKVIGKQGRTARSLRTILGAASMKLKHRFSLDIVEVAGGSEEPL
ncbi:MAG: KH domain-containing protein [Janthinobacterium lividum]